MSMNVPLEAPAAETRGRLLRAGGQVFVERGFHRATVRQIVARAGANLAAVNYHFRDKKSLYAAVLEHAAREALDRHPPYGGLSAEAPPEEQLRAFVHAFLKRLFDPDTVYGRLMAREMIEPTAALDRIVEQVMRPLYGRLCRNIRALSGGRLPLSQLELAAKSVVGQILFYKHCAPVLERLEGRPLDERKLGPIADHIAAFSLAAIRGLAGRSGKGRP